MVEQNLAGTAPVDACVLPGATRAPEPQTPTDVRGSTQGDVGERFARALAAKDAEQMKALLSPGLDFRAMTPLKFWESDNVDVIVDRTILGTWFAPDRRITRLSAMESGDVGSVHRVGYQFEVTRPDGDFVIEQQAYYRTDAGRISWLRIACSGFIPVA